MPAPPRYNLPVRWLECNISFCPKPWGACKKILVRMHTKDKEKWIIPCIRLSGAKETDTDCTQYSLPGSKQWHERQDLRKEGGRLLRLLLLLSQLGIRKIDFSPQLLHASPVSFAGFFELVANTMYPASQPENKTLVPKTKIPYMK